MTLPKNLVIDGTSYATADLPEAARVQVRNVQTVDAEIARLEVQLRIAQTARNAYAQALVQAVEAARQPVPTASELASAKPKKAVPTKAKAKPGK